MHVFDAITEAYERKSPQEFITVRRTGLADGVETLFFLPGELPGDQTKGLYINHYPDKKGKIELKFIAGKGSSREIATANGPISTGDIENFARKVHKNCTYWNTLGRLQLHMAMLIPQIEKQFVLKGLPVPKVREGYDTASCLIKIPELSHLEVRFSVNKFNTPGTLTILGKQKRDIHTIKRVGALRQAVEAYYERPRVQQPEAEQQSAVIELDLI